MFADNQGADDISSDFSKLDLSMLTITKDMLTDLISSMERQSIDSMSCAGIINSLKQIAIGSKRKTPTNLNANDNGNNFKPLGMSFDNSPASSISSGISFNSPVNLHSPIGDFKFKTPVKAFTIDAEKALLKTPENKRRNGKGKTKSPTPSRDIIPDNQASIESCDFSEGLPGVNGNSTSHSLLSPTQKPAQPQKPYFGAMPPVEASIKVTSMNDESRSQNKENMQSQKLEVNHDSVTNNVNESNEPSLDKTKDSSDELPIFSNSIPSFSVGADSMSSRRRAGRKLGSSSTSSSTSSSVRGGSLFAKILIPPAPTTTPFSVPLQEDKRAQTDSDKEVSGLNSQYDISQSLPTTLFNIPSTKLPSKDSPTFSFESPGIGAKSVSNGNPGTNFAGSSPVPMEEDQVNPGKASPERPGLESPLFGPFSSTGKEEAPQTPTSMFSYSATHTADRCATNEQQNRDIPTKILEKSPSTSPSLPDITNITADLSSLTFSLGSGLGSKAATSEATKKKPWLQSANKSKRRPLSCHQSSDTSPGAGMECSTGTSPLSQAGAPTADPPAKPFIESNNNAQNTFESSSDDTAESQAEVQHATVDHHKAAAEEDKAGCRADRAMPPDVSRLSSDKFDEVTVRMCALAEGYRREGKNLYTQEEYDKALDCFSKALQVAPHDWANRPSVLSNRAATYMMLDRFVEAEKDCEVAMKLDPLNSQKVQARRARALLRLGLLAKAHDAFCHLIDNHNDEQSTEDGQAGKAQVQSARAILCKLPDFVLRRVPKLVISSADELLQICPQMRTAQTFRAQALCLMQRWSEAKLYMEKCTCLAHESIQALYAHGSAQLPAPKPEDLQWVEIGVGLIRTNVAAAVQALLFMGPEMGLCYVNALKNGESVRNSCNDVMDSIKSVLLIISSRVGSSPSWSWVQEEERKIRLCTEAKVSADKHFRQREYTLAYKAYTVALQIDSESYRLRAILCSNRAAASMSLGQYEDAVADCLESIVCDPDYCRAYLRRARAYRAMDNKANSIRDYKKYLQFSPAPADIAEARAELDAYEKEGEVRTDAEGTGQRPHCVPFEGEAREEQPEPRAGYTQRENLHRRTSWTSSSNMADRDKRKPWFESDRQRSQDWSKDKSKSYDSTRERTSSGRGSSGYTSRSYGRGATEGKGPESTNASPPRQSASSRNGAYGSTAGTGTAGGTGASNGGGTGASNGGASAFMKDQKPTPDPADPTKEKNPSSMDFYELMGLSTSATERDVRVAYKRLALRYHPDKNKDPSAEDMFKAVTSAYSVLSDKSARKSYDHTRLYENVCGGMSGFNYRR